MSSDDVDVDGDTASQALYELARWVIRDAVDGKHLALYMRRLLNQQLVELHAVCRREAMKIAEMDQSLRPLEVAALLRLAACELEQTCPTIAVFSASEEPADADGDLRDECECQSIPIEEVNPRPRRSPWLPEFCAAVAFSALSISSIVAHCDDRVLRIWTASTFGCLGLVYAAAATHLAWLNAHSARSDGKP